MCYKYPVPHALKPLGHIQLADAFGCTTPLAFVTKMVQRLLLGVYIYIYNAHTDVYSSKYRHVYFFAIIIFT